MKRRNAAMALLGLGALLWGLSSAAFSQEPKGRIRRIGWIEPGSPSSFPERRDAFRIALHKLGHIEGQNFVVDYRYAHGKLDAFAALAAELVALKPDCVVAAGVDAILAVRAVASDVPIVMGTIDTDPIKEGLAASMARPGGSVTGLVGISWELAGKRLELLKEAFPKIGRVAILFDPRSNAGHAHVKAAEISARAINVRLHQYAVKETEDVHRAIRSARGDGVDALSVVTIGMVNVHRQRIAALAAEARLPTVGSSLEYVDDGGLIAYASNLSEQFGRAAVYVDKILRGAKPGDLSIEQPTKFVLALNARTAKEIGVSIPRSLVLRADRVIE